MNCLSEVISAPGKRAGCLGLEVWLRHIPGNKMTCNYFTPDLLIIASHWCLGSKLHHTPSWVISTPNLVSKCCCLFYQTTSSSLLPHGCCYFKLLKIKRQFRDISYCLDFFSLPLELAWAQTSKLSLPFGGAVSKFGPAKRSLMMDASAPPSLGMTAAVMGECWMGFRKRSHLHPLIQACRLACSQQILSVTVEYRETSPVLIISPAVFLLSHWRS